VLDLDWLPFQAVRQKLCSTAQMHHNPDKHFSSLVISQSEKSTYSTLCSKIMRRKADSRELKMQLHASTDPDKAIMKMRSDKGCSLLRNICIFILFYLLIVE